MELFGLKDKDGKEYSIELPENYIKLSEEYMKLIKPKPAFKVGDWACYCFRKGNRSTPFKIISFDEDRAMGNSFDGGGVTPECYIYELYSVTPAEIEAHLKYICDKKYIGKKIKKCLIFPNGNKSISTKPPHAPYSHRDDEYWMLTDEGRGVCVYKQGQFAEILPEPKKELPKTVEELKQLLHKYYRSPIASVTEFIRTEGYTD